MIKKYWRLGAFVFVVIIAILSQVFVQQRYTLLQAGGIEYQLPVALEKSASWTPVDYLDVKFLGNAAPIVGTRLPNPGEPVYISLDVKSTGMLAVKNASMDRPSTGEYVIARAHRIHNGVVEFDIPFNRVKVDLSKVDKAFYNEYKGTLIATMKLKDGNGVITGIYSKGVPLEVAKPETLEEQAKDTGRKLEDIIKSGTTETDVRVERN